MEEAVVAGAVEAEEDPILVDALSTGLRILQDLGAVETDLGLEFGADQGVEAGRVPETERIELGAEAASFEVASVAEALIGRSTAPALEVVETESVALVEVAFAVVGLEVLGVVGVCGLRDRGERDRDRQHGDGAHQNLTPISPCHPIPWAPKPLSEPSARR